MPTLKRLEISGFKSFVDPVTVDFADGVTAIVGPNGCGKSNLSDAITWVLGEQSAKSLRSETMQDVIFAGSERRRPLGMAEVRLTLGGLAAALGSPDETDTTISRRVFRSGESEYRLNGKRVPLKLIRDLLMDTGLGIRAYSVIEQGKVETILAGKPQERRKLIEEAAGITRYKARKRIAELKLEESAANLQRLDDIRAEADRSLRSLKRQAGAARRFKELQSEHQTLLEQWLGARAKGLAGELDRLERALEATASNEARALAAVSAGEAQLAEARELGEVAAARLAELRQRESRLLATIEGRQQAIRGAEQTLREIGERLERGQADAAARGAEVDDLDAQHQELTARLEAQRQATAEAESLNRRDETALAECAAAVQQAEVALREAEQLAANLARQLEKLRSDRDRQRVEVERSTSRQQHLFAELDGFAREIAESDQARSQVEQRLAGLMEAAGRTELAIAAADAELQRQLSAETGITERKKALEHQRAELTHRRAALDQLERAHDQGRKAEAAALASHGLDPQRRLADRITPPPQWERAFDHHLGALVDAVEIPSDRDPLEIAAALAAARVSTMLHAPTAAAPPAAPPAALADDPRVLGFLGSHLDGAALAPAALVASPDHARELALLHPEVAFLTQGGLVFQGSTIAIEGDQAQPGLLARRRELGQIRAEVTRLDQELEQCSAELGAQVLTRTAAAQKANQMRHDLGELKREIAVAEARREDANQRRRRLEAARERIESERAGVAQALAATEVRLRALDEGLIESERERQSQAARIEGLRSALEEVRGRREHLRAEAAARRAALELERERQRSLGVDLERVRRSAEATRNFLSGWSEEQSRLELRRRDQTEALELARTQLREALESQGGAQDEVVAAVQEVEARREQVRTLEQSLVAARAVLDEVRLELAGRRERRSVLDTELKSVCETYRDQLGATPDLDTLVPLELAAIEELSTQVARARRRLDEMGPVNVLAADEYAEQETRFIELGTQREDIAASVESLKRTIREINQTSMVRFRETLEEVNRHLGVTFTTLFRGGEAEIRLLDEEDVLESGIEIVARPPGKRLQNLMLMSGGEKALTAIALLMALFKTKPSPFCLLDEVDAPLDDLNTQRYLEIIRAMSVDTQFLVVTHNKITMEAASRLYGVTMAERGVSKVVSVDLEEMHPAEVAASA
jgi:chromosome segregation protein